MPQSVRAPVFTLDAFATFTLFVSHRLAAPPRTTLPACLPPDAADAPKALVGFDAREALVGRPLSCCIDVFGAWKARFGDEASLLSLLVVQALQSTPDTSAGNDTVAGPVSCAWRVGIHKPDATGTSSGAGQATGSSGSDSVLRTLQQRRVHAMCMTLELLQHASAHVDDLLRNEAEADATPVLQVRLQRQQHGTQTGWLAGCSGCTTATTATPPYLPHLAYSLHVPRCPCIAATL